MSDIRIDPAKLKTIANYANMTGVTTSNIYKMIKDKKLIPVRIDGVQYIDVTKYPTLPK